MSGTQDTISPAQNSPQSTQEVQSGIEQNALEIQEISKNSETHATKKLSASEKMDRLLRGHSSGYLKKELEKLRKEAAKYRSYAKEEENKKLEFQSKTLEIQNKFDDLKAKHRTLTIMRKLDNAGCLKSELVTKDIPNDLSLEEELDNFIENYKEQNDFLFKQQKASSIGGTFKTAGTKNLSPSQQMDAYIRAALRR